MPMTTEAQMRNNMNQMYGRVRYIYDVTRKYYLSGRDDMIENIRAKPDEHICEIGCGTARNLIKMAKRYPDSQFYGLDISDEMLKTAYKALRDASMDSNIQIVRASAHSFSPAQDFNLQKRQFDKVIFSYTLSMVPVWRECIDHALTVLNHGGEMHIVDFTSVKAHPFLIRKLMYPWLKMFHAYFATDIEKHLRKMESDGKGTLFLLKLDNSRASYGILKKS